MESAQLRWRWTITAALLGFLLLALVPGTSALQCHSYASVQIISGDRVKTKLSGSSSLSNCTNIETACMEAHLMISTEKMDMLITYRGCANEGLQNRTDYDNSSSHHLSLHSSVLYCHSDFCNMHLTDLRVFKMPRQEKAPEASGSNQCYSGFTQNPDIGILDRVTCGKDDTRCYQGNITITAGFLGVHFLVKTCQQPSCNVTESHSFGPIELKVLGSCCHGSFCNGKMADPDEQDIKTITVSPWNPFVHIEENEDDHPNFPLIKSGTLNPKPILPFYLLVIVLGIAILGIW